MTLNNDVSAARRVLLVDDEVDVCQTLSVALRRRGYNVSTAYHVDSALDELRRSSFDLVVADINLPGSHGLDFIRQLSSVPGAAPVVVISGDSRYAALDVQEVGAVSLIRKPINDSNCLLDVAEESFRYPREESPPLTGIHAGGLAERLLDVKAEDLISLLPGLRTLLGHVNHVVHTQTTVLITGETGTGKEVLARYIHSCSPRRQRRIVTVNCGALPENLVESELFGAEKGAFTGATSRMRGRFEDAHGGTLFLDEVGELSLASQAKLLRAIQEREINRLGSGSPIPIDIRLIAATNKDLKQAVVNGSFRSDLYYRLCVFPVHLPALKFRRDDMAILADFFVQRVARDVVGCPSPRLEPTALHALKAYSWPGNIRELQNVIERAVILHHDKPLNGDIIDELLAESSKSVVMWDGCTQTIGEEGLDEKRDASRDLSAESAEISSPKTLLEAQRTAIEAALVFCNGKVSGRNSASEVLEINPSTLRSLMERLGLKSRSCF